MYVVLVVFVIVYVALRFVNLSRTGRAWRSLREDPLAAEVMGMPVNSLKLMSFAFGAAIAALTRDVRHRVERERLPALVLVRRPDHHLHDGHPRRLRQPAGRRPRGGPDRGPARAAARPGRLARPLLPSRPRAARGSSALGRARDRRRGTLVFGLIVHSIAGAIDNGWVNGSGGEGGGVADFVSELGDRPGVTRLPGSPRLVRLAHRPRAGADAAYAGGRGSRS